MNEPTQAVSERFMREADITTPEALKSTGAALRAIVEDVKEVCCGQETTIHSS